MIHDRWIHHTLYPNFVLSLILYSLDSGASLWPKIWALSLLELGLYWVAHSCIHIWWQDSLTPLCNVVLSFFEVFLGAFLPFSKVYICHLLCCIKLVIHCFSCTHISKFFVIHLAQVVTVGRNGIVSMEIVSSLELTLFQLCVSDSTFHTYLPVKIMQQPYSKCLLHLIP